MEIDTYAAYYRLHKDREIAVYSGANDGMLHAFLAGVFEPGAKLTGDGAKFTVDGAKYGSLTAGDEIWAYIPRAFFPTSSGWQILITLMAPTSTMWI